MVDLVDSLDHLPHHVALVPADKAPVVVVALSRGLVAAGGVVAVGRVHGSAFRLVES